MYFVTAARAFTAYYHFPDTPSTPLPWHEYLIEIRVEGETLSSHGYLVDINLLKKLLEEIEGGWKGQVLNDLIDFIDVIPTVENVARITAEKVLEHLPTEGPTALEVRVWESEKKPAPSAGIRLDLGGKA